MSSQRPEEGPARERKAWYRTSPTEGSVFRTLAYATVAIVPLILVVWLPQNFQNLVHTDIFESTTIGGNLTLNQAKAVDFVSSAVFAPLILALLNYVWFQNARTAIGDRDKSRVKGMPLYAMIEASSTSSGSFDLSRLWTLCRTSSLRFTLFALLVLLAALAKSALSNVIAYEAFLRPIQGDSIRLRTLSGPSMESTRQVQKFDNGSTWEATYSQQLQFSKHVIEVLQRVRWQDSTASSGSEPYVTINVTDSDLASIDSSVTSLKDIPVVQRTMNCKPHKLQSLHWIEWSDGITVNLDREYLSYEATAPGWSSVADGFGTLVDGTDEDWTYHSVPVLGSGNDQRSIFVGVISSVSPLRYNDQEKGWIEKRLIPISTPFGEIQATAFNLSGIGHKFYREYNTTSDSFDNNLGPVACNATNTGCMAIVFGLNCTIHQEKGTAALDRASVGDTWTIKDARWNNGSKRTLTFSSVSNDLAAAAAASAVKCNNSQVLDEWDCAEYKSYPGRYDFGKFAQSVLVGQSKLRRVCYEVAATNSSLAGPGSYIKVPSIVNAQRYRMTYVPALLFFGLTCVFLSAVLTVALTTYTAGSVTFKRFRTIDNLRLLTDCMANIDDDEVQRHAKTWTNAELVAWAKRFVVGYEAQQADEGDVQGEIVVLRQLPRNNDPSHGTANSTTTDHSRYSMFDWGKKRHASTVTYVPLGTQSTRSKART